MGMNDPKMVEAVNKWWNESEENKKARESNIPFSYIVKYQMYMRFGAKIPLTEEEIRRLAPQEREIEGEPTQISQLKVGERYKIQVIVTSSQTYTYRGCKSCRTKVAEDEDECSNLKCKHPEAGISDIENITYKANDGTGKEAEDESVISLQPNPWQETPNLVGCLVTLQGGYVLRESTSKGKSYPNYNFRITRILRIKKLWGQDEIAEMIKQGEPVPPEVEYGGQPMVKSETSEKPKETLKEDGSKDLFKSTIAFLGAAMSSLDGKKIEYEGFYNTLKKRFSKVDEKDLGLVIDRLEKSGIIELDGSDKTCILHLKKEVGENEGK